MKFTIRDMSRRLTILGTLFSAAAVICAACATTGDQQVLPDVAPNPEILERIEKQFSAARRAYPELSQTRTEKPQSLSRDEVAAAARALDELGEILRALTALDAKASASRQSLRYDYKGESLSLEEAARRLTADLDAARRNARALRKAPAPVLGGPEPRSGAVETEATPPVIELVPDDESLPNDSR